MDFRVSKIFFPEVTDEATRVKGKGNVKRFVLPDEVADTSPDPLEFLILREEGKLVPLVELLQNDGEEKKEGGEILFFAPKACGPKSAPTPDKNSELNVVVFSGDRSPISRGRIRNAIDKLHDSHGKRGRKQVFCKHKKETIKGKESEIYWRLSMEAEVELEY